MRTLSRLSAGGLVTAAAERSTAGPALWTGGSRAATRLAPASWRGAVDRHEAALGALIGRRLGDRGGEALDRVAGDLDVGLARLDPDRADLVAGDVAAVAEQRHQPAGVGVAHLADVEPEPGRA